MQKLHLGVEDVAYSDPDAKGATTTGQVAEILEEKYHVMRVFAELHGQNMADAIAKDISNSLDAILGGERVSKLPLQTSMRQIESSFRDYLSADEWQKTSGQAIAAAQNGVSHRFKKVKGKERGPRPAFIDTGLFSRSFKAEIS